MVSGFFTSPWDHWRMSSAVASPMRSSSKKLTSSTCVLSSSLSLARAGSVDDVVDGHRLGSGAAGQVDAQVRRGPLEVLVVGVAHLDRLAVAGEHLDVQAERLELLEQHLQRLGDSRLGDVLALDDRLVDLHAAR